MSQRIDGDELEKALPWIHAQKQSDDYLCSAL